MSDHKARIIGGKFRRRIIDTPRCGQLVRPTTDALRELIFNVLENSLYINWSEFEVMDVCAGSGAFGLEALSRGASFCTFIDNNPISLRCIYKNIHSIGLDPQCKVLKKDVSLIDICEFIHGKTIAFIDPPYAHRSLLKKIVYDIQRTEKEVLCIIESDSELDFINPNLIKKRGASVVTFLKIPSFGN